MDQDIDQPCSDAAILKLRKQPDRCKNDLVLMLDHPPEPGVVAVDHDDLPLCRIELVLKPGTLPFLIPTPGLLYELSQSSIVKLPKKFEIRVSDVTKC